ncbi:hypothetical protein BDZ89DRAFT_1137933 [Hymenopellis radicata]|nr:hypothetical protein BDZ89DRAFT_1137933 [Hymenopellis radicata]
MASAPTTTTTTTRPLEEKFLNLCPPPLGREGAPVPDAKYAPVNFLDSHIDENLVLKRVEPRPTLIGELADLVDKTLDSLSNRDLLSDGMFGGAHRWYLKAADMNAAQDIAKRHEKGPSFAACRLASSLLIHPDRPKAVPAITWGSLEIETCDQHSSNQFLAEHCCLQFPNYSRADFLLQDYTAETASKLFALHRHQRVVAVALFFCPAAHTILRNMDELGTHKTFQWMANSESQISSPGKVSRPIDSPRPPWSLPEPIPVPPQDRTIRRSPRTDSPVVEYCTPGRVVAGKRVEWREKPEQYVQRAWATAVRADASVIIFDCGNYLRVGVRHRETQTLLLSDLVDVCRSNNPAYGKIWAGVHMAALDDVLQRFEIHTTPEKPPSSKRKHSPLLDDDPPAKKQKMSEKAATSRQSKRDTDAARKKAPSATLTVRSTVKQAEALQNSFHRRPALALYVRSGIYNSPTPSILLKAGQPRLAKYTSNSYLTLVLGSRLGRGATGDVYTGIVPKAKHGPVVVKLATTFERLCRLRHEYSIYTHLHAAGVKCIPRVFGYYQDAYRNVGALVLSNGGQNLGGRGEETLNEDEQKQLRSALASIHAAGVIHRDLRSWNILVDAGGQISIIDFDRASTSPSHSDFEKESARLEKFLAGKHIDDGQIIGNHTMAANIGDLVNDNNDV